VANSGMKVTNLCRLLQPRVSGSACVSLSRTLIMFTPAQQRLFQRNSETDTRDGWPPQKQ
jgi:hypothetical protein